jgi:cation diffusion facilitator family transporter
MFSIAIKSSMYLTKRNYGRKLLSSALAADAWNDGVDVVSGTVALIGVSLESLGGRRFGPADDIGGCGVGLIVILLGVRIVRDTTFQLMDTMPEQRLLEQIRQVALRVPGALGIEKCFARKTGLQYHVDLHLEVDPDMTVSASHDIATQVREKIRSDLPWVADVLVHVEPHGLGQ